MSKKHLFFSSIALLLFASQACSRSTSLPPQIPESSQMSQPTPISQYFNDVSCLSFGGKVVNEDTGEWVNNRLILVFFKGNEIARTTSLMRELIIAKPPFQDEGWASAPSFVDKVSSNGIEDGLFLVSVPNIYGLTLSTLGIPPEETLFFEGNTYLSNADWESECGNVLVSWLYPIYEGQTKEYFIPSKNVTYTLKVLPGDMSQLPAEIQQRGSLKLLDGNRLVAIDPNAPTPTPQPAFSNNIAQFEKTTEDTYKFPPVIFPINNCSGVADIKQEITHTYIHEIIDETKEKLGIELPIFQWITIVAEIERHYGISDKQITTYSTTLTVPAGQNIQYTAIRKQTWESGIATVVSSDVEISAPYRILKNETYEVSDSEQKACP